MVAKEKFTLTTKDIALMGVMLAVLEIAKFALSSIAGVEVVTLLFIVYTLFFGKKMVYMLPAYLLIDGILSGFGIWWFMYVYIWALLVWITYMFRKNKSVWFWSMISGLFGLFFGLLCCPVYFITNGVQTGIAWWIAGIPTDILHGVSNFVLCMILFKPLNNELGRLKGRYLC